MLNDKTNTHRHLLYLSFLLGLSGSTIVCAEATLDGSLGGATGTRSGNFVIDQADGVLNNSNLFHSFSYFSINSGESATFTATSSIDNVISRVTGNDISIFNGPLDSSSITGANFYFINPNGIIFKEGASITVDGSFYASTSDYLRLGQDGIIYADANTESTLTSSAPVAFGFLGSNPGSISFEGSHLVTGVSLNIPAGENLAFIGGDIRFDQASQGANTLLSAILPGATGSFIGPTDNPLQLVSAVSTGEAVSIAGDYDLSSFDSLGNITLTGGSLVDATNVYIRGGQVIIDNALIAPGFLYLVGQIDVNTNALAPAPPLNGGKIDIAATEFVNITGSGAMQTFAAPYIPRPDGGGSYIPGITTFGGHPLAPPLSGIDISLTGGDISISNQSAVISERLGPGNAGNITITGDYVEIRNGAFVANVNTYAGSGGNITVNAEQVVLDGEDDTTGLTGLNASSTFNPGFGNLGASSFDPNLTNGDAGTITVNATGAGGLTIKSGASISSDSRAFGKAGNIDINATNITLSRDSKPFGAISSQSAYAGDGGNIDIHSTGDITIKGGFEIASSVQGTGTGGNITVTADNAITITGTNSGIASATTQPSEQVKNELAYLFASSDFDSLIIDINNFAGGPLLQPDASLYDVLGALQLLGLINLNDPSPTAGSAGTVSVDTSSLTMSDSSRITSSTTSDGNGGDINIKVNTLTIGTVAEIRSRSGLTNTTGIFEVGTGSGGDISIKATDSVSMQDEASISSSSKGTGLAGNIYIDAGSTLTMKDSSISTEATVSDGGNITLMAVNQIYLNNSDITTSVESGTGDGGNIDIDPEFVILKSSNILANAYGGPGGNISIVGDNFLASADSLVDASSALGIDGTINISSPDEDVSDDLVVLPDNILDVTSLISERCGSTSASSSLVNAGPGGMTVDPDGYLPSFAVATYQEETEVINRDTADNEKHWSSLYYVAKPGLDITQITCNKL